MSNLLIILKLKNLVKQYIILETRTILEILIKFKSTKILYKLTWSDFRVAKIRDCRYQQKVQKNNIKPIKVYGNL